MDEYLGRSLPVVVPGIDRTAASSSVILKFVIPRTNMSSWAVSRTSRLSSKDKEKNIAESTKHSLTNSPSKNGLLFLAILWDITKLVLVAASLHEVDELPIDSNSDVDIDDEEEDPSYVVDDDELDEDRDETREYQHAPASENISGAPVVKRKRGQQAGDARAIRSDKWTFSGRDTPQNEKPWMGGDDPDTA
ncbi:hypothetical protein Q8A73_012767 [Channa argus]|nr:hypothetical protein Q8A73_012767 [Channa argus]